MTDAPPSDRPARKGRFLLITAVVACIAALAGVGAALLLVDITKKEWEGKNPYFRVAILDDGIENPETWGKNFPLQYDGYRRTVDQVRTRYGGSEARPRTPTDADPRSLVSQSRLEEDPRLVTVWDGYAFSKDFREERGHAYMLDDQTFTGRQQAAKQPGACINCHASIVIPYRKLGGGDIAKGFSLINPMPYAEARKLVTSPVACIDCHDPETMALRITRPAFKEGIRAWKASQGIKDYDVDTMATRQEMRAYVCGQCHVEYYFRGAEKTLVYPWSKGLHVEEILAYYDEVGHKDWTHARSGADVLKAQHPEFEMWNQGIHARSGVACADCHMPYHRTGAQKISDHHVASPVLDPSRACGTCHRLGDEELRARVRTIQDRTYRLRDEAMDAVVALIADLEAAKGAGKPDADLAAARLLQRHAQFRLDFIEAENSMGFHAPQEAARILAESMDLARQGQLALRDPSFKPRQPTPSRKP